MTDQRKLESQDIPRNPKRVEDFVHFFSRYMRLSTVIVAALPLPLTGLGVIPTYDVQTQLLASYTSMFCFLALAFLFYTRQPIARYQFFEVFIEKPRRRDTFQKYLARFAPLALILISFTSVWVYHEVLDRSIEDARTENDYAIVRALAVYKALAQLPYETTVASPTTTSASEQLDSLGRDLERFGVSSLADDSLEPVSRDLTTLEILQEELFNPLAHVREDVPFGTWLILLHMLIFLAAETAFVLMALKEYMQDILGLEDDDLTYARQVAFKKAREELELRSKKFQP